MNFILSKLMYGPILVIRIMLMSYKKKCDFWQTFGISEDVKFF